MVSDLVRSVREDFPKEVTTELKSGKQAGVTEGRRKGRTSTQKEQPVQRPRGRRKHCTNEGLKEDA